MIGIVGERQFPKWQQYQDKSSSGEQGRVVDSLSQRSLVLHSSLLEVCAEEMQLEAIYQVGSSKITIRIAEDATSMSTQYD